MNTIFRRHPLAHPMFPLILAATLHCEGIVFRPGQREYEDLDARQKRCYDENMRHFIRRLTASANGGKGADE